MKHLRKAPHSLILSVLLLAGCAGSRSFKGPQTVVYHIADKTSRKDILTQTAIVLAGYSFTIDYINSQANQSALRTNWRTMENEIETEDGPQLIEFRDRAIVHLSAKGYQGHRISLVSSRIEFEMQMRTEQSDKWVRITPEPQLEDQYHLIVNQIQSRLRRLGYRFN